MNFRFCSRLAGHQAALLSGARKCCLYLGYSSSQGSLPCMGSAPQVVSSAQTLLKASLELFLHSLSSFCSQSLGSPGALLLPGAATPSPALMAREAQVPRHTDSGHFPAHLATTNPYRNHRFNAKRVWVLHFVFKSLMKCQGNKWLISSPSGRARTLSYEAITTVLAPRFPAASSFSAPPGPATPCDKK